MYIHISYRYAAINYTLYAYVLVVCSPKSVSLCKRILASAVKYYNSKRICVPADCPAEEDELWNIRWPFTPPQTRATVSCGVDFVGRT